MFALVGKFLKFRKYGKFFKFGHCRKIWKANDLKLLNFKYIKAFEFWKYLECGKQDSGTIENVGVERQI